MGNALKAYTEKYEDQDQMLFQAIIKFRRGNKKAFEQVYNLSERYIYAIIYRIVRDNDKTADLMQDTYIQIYRKIHTLKNVEAFFIWAGRIATNNTLRFIQKDSREVLLDEEENDFVFENVSDDKEEFLPEDILLNKEKCKKIRDIINNLSQEQKITVLNYYFGEMSVSEIAQAMQCSPGTVKSRLNYARKQIKQAVLDTEKREGVKLYSLSTLPLFTLLLREEMANIVVPEIVSSSVVKGMAEALGINIAETVAIEIAELGKKGIKGIKEMIHKFFETTGGKVASGIAAAAVAGAVAVTQIPTTIYVTSNSIFESTYGLIHNKFYSYSSEEREFKYLIDDQYLIFQNDDWQLGVYTIEGKEVLPFEFDSIEYNEYTGGLFKVKKDNKEAYYDKSGKMVCDSMYDFVSYVVDDMFYCNKDYKHIVYSVEGNKVSNTYFDDIDERVNGLITVKKKGKWGVLREDGELIVDFLYDEAYLGDGEYIALSKTTEDGTRLTVLDNHGNVVFTKDSMDGLYFDSGYYNGVASLVGSVGISEWIDLPVKADGSILFDSTQRDYSVYNQGYGFHLYKNGYFSYYNDKMDKVVLFNTEAKPVASASGFTYEFGKFVAEDNGKYSLIDSDGNVILSEYDDIQFSYKGKYFICSGYNGYDLYNSEGTLLFNDANEIYSIGCEMFECRLDNGAVIVNGQDGTSFTLSIDEMINTYSDGYAVKITLFFVPVKTEYHFTYEIIDKNGRVAHRIKTPNDTDSYVPKVNAIVLKKGIYSYEHKDEGKCYIKTW